MPMLAPRAMSAPNSDPATIKAAVSPAKPSTASPIDHIEKKAAIGTGTTVLNGDLAVNIASFARHLRAENLSPRTMETYTESARQLVAFLAESDSPAVSECWCWPCASVLNRAASPLTSS